MQVVSPGDVGQYAVVRTRDHADVELSQILQYLLPVLQLPPALDVAVLFDATKHNGRVCRNVETISKLFSRVSVKLSCFQINDAVKRKCDGVRYEPAGPGGFVIDERNDLWKGRTVDWRRPWHSAETKSTDVAYTLYKMRGSVAADQIAFFCVDAFAQSVAVIHVGAVVHAAAAGAFWA